MLVLEDATGRTAVFCRGKEIPQAGDVISVSGHARVSDSLGAIVVGTNSMIIGRKDLPPAADIALYDLNERKHDLMLFRSTGTVIEHFRDEIDPDTDFLIVKDKDTIIPLALAHATNAVLPQLLNARIGFLGRYHRLVDGHRKFSGPYLAVSSPTNISVLSPSPADGFCLPELEFINGIAGRNCLTGIFKYVNSGLDWSIRFFDTPESCPGIVEHLSAADLDGVIISLDHQSDLLPRVLATRLPVVMIHDKNNAAPSDRRNFVLIKNDDLAIGRLGARHLLGKGRFASFVYIPTENRTSWSIYRERGFHLELAQEGITPRRWHRNHMSLDRFLAALPQPVAVMGATDVDSMLAIEACRTARMSIPSQVAIVSVDNDEMLCESTKPPLTSIRTDDVGIGELAARALDRLMSAGKRTPPARVILVKPADVIERASTRAVPPAGHLIQTALRYIRANVGRGITVEDVVRHLRVSSSLARTRFAEVTGKSIRDTILDARLALAEKKLRATSEPIARIAKSCGFSSACRLAHFFRERHNCSPSEFRNLPLNARRPTRRHAPAAPLRP